MTVFTKSQKKTVRMIPWVKFGEVKDVVNMERGQFISTVFTPPFIPLKNFQPFLLPTWVF